MYKTWCSKTKAEKQIMTSDMTEEMYKKQRNSRYTRVQGAHFQCFYDYLVDDIWFRIITSVVSSLLMLKSTSIAKWMNIPWSRRKFSGKDDSVTISDGVCISCNMLTPVSNPFD